MSEELRNLTKLEVLDLSSNHIKRIRNITTGPIKETLRILKLANNKIKKMKGIEGLSKLTKLDLSTC